MYPPIIIHIIFFFKFLKYHRVPSWVKPSRTTKTKRPKLQAELQTVTEREMELTDVRNVNTFALLE